MFKSKKTGMDGQRKTVNVNITAVFRCSKRGMDWKEREGSRRDFTTVVRQTTETGVGNSSPRA